MTRPGLNSTWFPYGLTVQRKVAAKNLVAVPSPARKVETTIPERKVTSLAPRRVLDLANPNRNQVAKTQPRQALAARVQLAVRKLETKRMSLRGGVRC
ncbi:unnamed protein product [Amoebophrya sp. A120]|nr:unnamed protein product [Amoebophrya sp. A120]|eukprot:GSA120T00026286001.1